VTGSACRVASATIFTVNSQSNPTSTSASLHIYDLHKTTSTTMISNRFIRLACKRQLQRPVMAGAERLFSFNFAGPKTLEDILKKELIEDKSATEVADLWYTYHENKVTNAELSLL